MEHETPPEQLSIDRFRAQMSSERMPDTVQVTMLGHREENGVEVALPFLKKNPCDLMAIRPSGDGRV